MQNIKEAWKNMPGKTKNIILAIAVGTVFLAVIGIAVLNLSSDKRYSTLFVGKEAHPQNPQPWEAGITGAIVVSHKIDRCVPQTPNRAHQQAGREGGHPLPQGRIEKPPPADLLSYGKEQIDHRTVDQYPQQQGYRRAPRDPRLFHHWRQGWKRAVKIPGIYAKIEQRTQDCGSQG